MPSAFAPGFALSGNLKEVPKKMTCRIPSRVLRLSLLIASMLLISGSVVAMGQVQPHAIRQALPVAQDSLTLAAAGMGEIMSQTFEFTGDFPVGWYVYDSLTHTQGTGVFSYGWSTTGYTYAEGLRSAWPVGAPLTGSLVYPEPVDVWMVYGPVNLASVAQAQLDFKYLLSVPVTSSVHLTVAVSADYDPISRTGTFSGKGLAPASAWTTDLLDLAPYRARNVYVAFRYQSSSEGNVTEGPFVDDLHLGVNYRIYLPLVSKWTLSGSTAASSPVVFPGQTVVYTLTIHNSDPAVQADVAVLSSALPNNTTFVSADGAYNYDAVNRIINWTNLVVPAAGSTAQHLTIRSDVPMGYNQGNDVVLQPALSVASYPGVYYFPPFTVTTPFTYSEDFSNPASGWLINDYDPALANCPAPGPWVAHYLSSGGIPGGAYGVSTACAWNGQIFPAPVRTADPSNFIIQTDMRSNQDFLFQTSYGLFFNGDENLKQMYIARVFQGLDPMDLGVYIWYRFDGSSDDSVDLMHYSKCWTCNSADGAWNRLVVQRQGNAFSVYAGPTGGSVDRVAGPFVGGWANQYVDNNHVRVGVHQGNFEWGWHGNVISYVFDNFGLTPARR